MSDMILRELLVLERILTIFIPIARLCKSFAEVPCIMLAVVRIRVDSYHRPDVVSRPKILQQKTPTQIIRTLCSNRIF